MFGYIAIGAIHDCSSTIMNDLSAIGEDQLSWKEWLSTHLMPLYMVVQLPDGEVEVRQRVLSECPMDPRGTSTTCTDKVSFAGGKCKIIAIEE